MLAILTLLMTSSPMFAAAQAQGEQTYWLGRQVGTDYVFDTRLPADFAAMVTASGPKYAAHKDLPEFSTQVIDGKTYSFVTTDVSWDRDAIDKGSISYIRNGTLGAAWFNMDASSAEWQALAEQVKAQAKSGNGSWKSAELWVLISSGAETPTVRVPIPEATLIKDKMDALAKETQPGIFYPKVKIPTDLAAFQAQMLAYGNLGRRDPDFRKNNGSKTATDLSGDTVNTLAGVEKVYKQSETPPYFDDHVLNDELNRAAQFQAEYQASINKLGHDGPRYFRDPTTGKSGDLSTLGKRAEFFGTPPGVAEAAGVGGVANFPHAWMAGETHFRPWFNVNGDVDRVGYGAAMSANGTWYFAAVVAGRDKASPNAGGSAQATPAPSTLSPTATESAAAEGTLLSLQSSNYPERFVRHTSYRGRIDPITNELDQKDSTFRLVSGLADDSYVSLESINFPGYYLVVEGREIMLRERKSNDAQFDKNATFIKQPGLSDPTLLSLESYAQRGNYIRHSGFKLYVDATEDADIYRADASFKQTAPNWTPPAAPTATQAAEAPASTSAATPAPLKLEIGKEYVNREQDGTHRYFRYVGKSGNYHRFELCPYAGRLGWVDMSDTASVMSVEAAMAQNIKPTNESCAWGEENRVLNPEIGKQYAILEENDTFSYFKVSTVRAGSYRFDKCPTPGSYGWVTASNPTNVMRVDVALAQNLTPMNEPCPTGSAPYGN